MSYSDQTESRSPASIVAVVGVHIAIGYALISGLAYTVIRQPPWVTVGTILPDDPPPPPPNDFTPPKAKPQMKTSLAPTQRLDESVKTVDVIISQLADTGTALSGGAGPSEAMPPPQPQPKADLSRRLVPAADRGRWITSADYPSAELRAGITGTVTIATMIGPDGRVQSCEVTKSSGSRGLDNATCRLYSKRAHFAPALDADGNPVASRGADRFRWEIPE